MSYFLLKISLTYEQHTHVSYLQLPRSYMITLTIHKMFVSVSSLQQVSQQGNEFSQLLILVSVYAVIIRMSHLNLSWCLPEFVMSECPISD